MSVKCQCGLDVPDAVSRDVLKEQVKNARTEEAAKFEPIKAERDLLKTEVATLGVKAQGYDAVIAERDTLKTEVAAVKEGAARSAAFTAKGVPADEKARKTFEIVYNAEMATAAEDQRKTFAEWLDADAAQHPVLSRYIGQPAAPVTETPAAPPAAGAPAVPAAPKPPPPTPNAGAAPAPGQAQGVMSPAQMDAYLESKEYQSLPIADRRAKLNELRQRVATSRVAGA